MSTQPNTNYFDMPDDEIMGMSAPAGTPEVEEEDEKEPVVVEPEPEVVEPVVADPVEPVGSNEGNVEPDEGDTVPVVTNEPVVENKNPGDKPAEPVAPVTEENKEPDYKGFYEKLLGNPIKANGKEIQLRSPEEAERLIQMGLNYTKKMQSWQPRIRLVTMLENNGLLDEAKLAHLIDLSKGNPGAIQKLLVDSKFDPMGADAEKAASYRPDSHRVSDSELAFNAVLDEIESSETGAKLISEVAKQWDEQSRQAVYRDPTILQVINEQRSIGLYDRITAEMDHQAKLGHLQGIPFLQAYRAVGDMLKDQGRLIPETQKPAVERNPVATRVAAAAAPVTNGDRAKAASPTRNTPAGVRPEPTNYLDIPDDEFLKTMQGRV